MLSNVCGVILAGGLGTRLRSAVADRPKVLAPVAGRPFISYLLDQLDKAGVKKVVLCTGYLAETIEAEFGKTYRSIRLSYSVENSPLGTAGALRNCLEHISSEHVMVLNGDSYCESDLEEFWKWHMENGASASVLLNYIDDTGRYGRVVLDGSSRVTGFIEKGKEGAGFINAGIYLLERRLVSEIPADQPLSLERDFFPRWAAEGVLFGLKAEIKQFIDIGTPESYEKAQKLFHARQLQSGESNQ